MKITACPICGSKNIDIADMRDGSSPHIHWETKACRECGWTGTPLEFESEKEYQKFLDDLKKEDKIQDKGDYIDPAESAPIRRHIKRSFVAHGLMILAFVIVLIVFAFFYEVLGQSVEISIGLAFLSLLIYFYFVWKYELWNAIKR